MNRSSPPLSAFSQTVLLVSGIAILAMISGTFVWLVARTNSDTQRVIETLAIKVKLSDLQRVLWRTESHQRGYLLSGDGRYLEAFRDDLEVASTALAEAGAAIADSAVAVGDKELADELPAAVAAQLAEFERSVARRQSQGIEGVLPLFSGVLLPSRTDEIRSTISRLIRQEQDLLAMQLLASQSTGRFLLAASLSGALFIIVLAATSIALVRRSTARLRAAQAALEEANESLEATVARRTAELQQANEEIRHFAHIVSHDLRSPLVNIMGFTSELEHVRKELFERLSSLAARLGDSSEADERLGREFDEAVSFIKSSITRMDRLIKAILKLTREGRRELRMERIEMTELVRSIADGLGYQAHEAGASITVAPLPPVIADRLALEQIFANLLENALKYLRPGIAGQIRVTGRATPAEIVYEVQDNGRGIDAKDHERIFEIFRRSGPQDCRGEGIGLTHVRTLVRRLGGAITVSSEPGRGSTFTVSFPRRGARQPEESR